MSRRRKPKLTQAQVEELARQKADRKAHVEALRAQGLDVKCDAQWNIIVTRRLDVFSLLHERRSLTSVQVDAIRRLETLVGVAYGHEKPDLTLDRVDRSTEGAPGQNITQAMVDASADLRDVMDKIGPVNARLLDALLTEAGAALTRWRATVERITTETRPETQAAMIRQACENLAQAWVWFDYRARQRREKAA